MLRGFLMHGQVAMLATADRPSTDPLISDLYAKPVINFNTPTEPLPGWFKDILIGPAPAFHGLLQALSDITSWGVHTKAVQYREYHDHITNIHAQLHHLKADLEDAHLAHLLTQPRLEIAQASKHIGYLHLMVLGTMSPFAVGPGRKDPKLLIEDNQPKQQSDVTGIWSRKWDQSKFGNWAIEVWSFRGYRTGLGSGVTPPGMQL